MFHSRVHIEVGDLVIIFMSKDNMVAITVTPGEHFHNKFGKYKHDDMVGKKFGSKMHSPPPQSGYIHLLRPTPELWTLSLPHRTQILYMPDIAYIIMKLGVRVGGAVIEAGTGSGSMTHSLSRTVGPRGTVNSFEYHRIRYEKALEEFEQHDLKNVTLKHRNVCKDGFGELSNIEGVFLDLPAPWEAIPFAAKTLRTDMITRICCFSPCLEQVLKTVAALRAQGFSDVTTQEVLVRSYDLIPPAPLPNSVPFHTISSITEKLREHERKREERRLIQMRNARERNKKIKEAEAAAAEAAMIGAGETAENEKEPKEAKDEARDDEEEAATVSQQAQSTPEQTAAESALPLKRKAEDAELDEGDMAVSAMISAKEGQHTYIKNEKNGVDEEANEMSGPVWIEPETSWSSTAIVKPSPEMRGHTSYLTFATMYPLSIRDALANQESSTPRVLSRKGTPVGGLAAVTIGGASVVGRVAELVAENATAKSVIAGLGRAGSVETDYTDDGMDAVMGTLTEEEMIALSASS